MIIEAIQCPAAANTLLPPVQQRVRRRLGNFALACGLVECSSRDLGALLTTGFLPILESGVGLAATSCPRPLASNECASIAKALGIDALLMRFDALSGVSFDVMFDAEQEWQSHCLAWRRPGMDMWLIPESDSGPFIHIDKRGLHPQDEAPFVGDLDRDLGIIRATVHPSFAGEL